MKWFSPLGVIYKPASPAGWIVTLLALAFCAHIFIFADSHSHSVSDMLYHAYPFVVPTFLLWVWVAGKKS